MSKTKRIITVMLALIVGFVLMFSFIFTTIEAHHACAEEHCPICYQINICENTLKTLSSVIVTTSVVIALVYSLLACLAILTMDIQVKSLVTLKVKLSN